MTRFHRGGNREAARSREGLRGSRSHGVRTSGSSRVSGRSSTTCAATDGIRPLRPSPYAHARIVSIDVAKALELDGVHGTITATRSRSATRSSRCPWSPAGTSRTTRSPWAGCDMGEPVAAVCAATRELARDAADLIEVDYDPLPVLVDAEESLEGRDGAPRRRGLERRLVGRLRLGRRRPGARGRRPRGQDRESSTSTASPRRRSNARALSSSTTRAPASGSTPNHQMPGVGAIWMAPAPAPGSTSSASSRRTSAAASEQDLPAPAARRSA